MKMIKNLIAGSKNPLFLPVKIIFYALKNKYYEVNDLIEKSEILSNGNILLTLKNGIKFVNKPSKHKADINFTERYKYGIKSKMDKIFDVEKYYFLYDLIHEVILSNQYFSHFDINKNDVVFDIGANIGSFTLLAAQKLQNTGKIYAIEPDDDNFEILCENIKINNLTNVVPIKKGLWSKKETKVFYLSHRPGEHTLLEHNDDEFKQTGKISIDCITLDELVDEYKIDKINFIKMDIEGAEIEAMKGSQKVLSMDGINWFVEAMHECDGQPTYHKIVPVFEQAGYKILQPVVQYRGAIYAAKQ